MYSISSNGIITLEHGDYFEVPMVINAGDEFCRLKYILDENDQVYLSIMEPHQPFEFGVIRKIYTQADLNAFGDVIVRLETRDTENLVPGIYYYEVKSKIRHLDEEVGSKDYVETIVPKRKFILL